jgi:putative addiction module component (TIGR02574 family)
MSYNQRVAPDVIRVLAEALKLTTRDRAALAAQLLKSLEDQVDFDAEDEWAEEIGRRVAELDAGEVRAVPWSQARATIGSHEPPR